MRSVTSQPNVVALHGFTGGASSWDRVAAALSPEYELWAADLPGHGGWFGDLPQSFESTVDHLAAVIRERSTDPVPVHLLGYSLGARLALGLLLEHPELFHSATLIGVRPGLSGKARDERVSNDEGLADDLGRRGLQDFVERWEGLPLFASQHALAREILAEQRRRRLSHDPAGLAWALRTLSPGRMPDYRPRLGEIQVPVRLMVGELDTAFLDIASEACDHRRDESCDERLFHLEVVADAGHNLPLEAPAAVARAVRSSLEAVRFLPDRQTASQTDSQTDPQPDKQPREQPA